MKIIKETNRYPVYSVDNSRHKARSNTLCWYCSFNFIDKWYMSFLRKLKAKNLVPKTYKPICCECYDFLKRTNRSIPIDPDPSIQRELREIIQERSPFTIIICDE